MRALGYTRYVYLVLVMYTKIDTEISVVLYYTVNMLYSPGWIFVQLV